MGIREPCVRHGQGSPLGCCSVGFRQPGATLHARKPNSRGLSTLQPWGCAPWRGISGRRKGRRGLRARLHLVARPPPRPHARAAGHYTQGPPWSSPTGWVPAAAASLPRAAACLGSNRCPLRLLLFPSSSQFSGLLGTVYRRGNLSFTRDGSSLVSPVGNRISLFDLKKWASRGLPLLQGLKLSSGLMSCTVYKHVTRPRTSPAFSYGAELGLVIVKLGVWSGASCILGVLSSNCSN